ncbi:MAG: peptidoglycan-binding protein [Granulosicoccus sp.]
MIGIPPQLSSLEIGKQRLVALTLGVGYSAKLRNMSVIYLGHCDAGCVPSKPQTFLGRFHNVAGSAALKDRVSFRDDDRSTWRRFKEVSSGPFNVSDIHGFLHRAGFMPRARAVPVFDYVTQASVRLFQEYLRTMEGIAEMVPDGIVGQQTHKHMQRWQTQNQVCEWASGQPSKEYELWMKTLALAKNTYAVSRPSMIRKIDEYPGQTDTRKVADWSFNSSDIHLIGIRSDEQVSTDRRQSNDIFILLVNGQVFKFWGSTDPNAKMNSKRKDEAFLVEGQHKYRFSWHKVSEASKVYRALRPYKHGVLVLRDRDFDNALTKKDIDVGFDKNTNHVINIHWSGIGASNWSAGCQVIAGKSYINPRGQAIDCSSFAATNYGQLNTTHRKTKAAYNMLADLVLCYAKPSVDYLLYSLGRDESFKLTDAFEADYVKKTFSSMQV